MVSKSLVAKSFAALLLGVLPLAAGCTTSKSGDMSGKPAMSSAPTRAVVVTARTGQTTIFYPASDGTVMAMSDSTDAACDHCKMDVMAYFKGGALPKTCGACQASYKAVMTH